jgi:hypothetical protein
VRAPASSSIASLLGSTAASRCGWLDNRDAADLDGSGWGDILHALSKVASTKAEFRDAPQQSMAAFIHEQNQLLQKDNKI